MNNIGNNNLNNGRKMPFINTPFMNTPFMNTPFINLKFINISIIIIIASFFLSAVDVFINFASAMDFDTYSKRHKYLSFLGQSIPSNNITALFADNEDERSIFIGTDRGLSKYNGKIFRTYGKDAGHYRNSPAGENINCVLPTSSEIWIATDSGLSRYNKVLSQWTYFEQGDDNTTIPTNYIQCLYFMDPFLYVGTWGCGVCIYNVKINKWKHYTAKSGLEGKYVSAIAYDNIKGQLWFATYDDGLYLFQDERFMGINAKTSELVSNKINCLAASGGKLYIGTPEGLSIYDGSKFISYTKEKGLNSNVILSIKVDKFDIYLGTDAGLYKIYNDTLTYYPIKNSLSKGRPVRISCIETIKNKLYLGTQHHGLIEVNKK